MKKQQAGRLRIGCFRCKEFFEMPMSPQNMKFIQTDPLGRFCPSCRTSLKLNAKRWMNEHFDIKREPEPKQKWTPVKLGENDYAMVADNIRRGKR